ncbi:MAG TPA: hypothetical protein VE990_00620 [Acidimicrobiales bacterium]|nr:hypothetical protein [Acidimicrobiales bacterium]
MVDVEDVVVVEDVELGEEPSVVEVVDDELVVVDPPDEVVVVVEAPLPGGRLEVVVGAPELDPPAGL